MRANNWLRNRDAYRPVAVRLSVAAARALGEGALAAIGYSDDDARIAGPPRILAMSLAA
jgi:hypothetical protein